MTFRYRTIRHLMAEIQKTYQSYLYRLPAWRRHFWNQMALNVHENYAGFDHDYGVIGGLIDTYQPASLLDYGCGSGRLIPLYLKKNLRDIYCYDASEISLKLAQEKFFDTAILFTTSLGDITRRAGRFDLIVCSRVLQHIPANSIVGVIGKICAMGDRVYINETLIPSDKYFMFLHDYRTIFEQNKFVQTSTGVMQDAHGNLQEWSLFAQG